MPNPTNPNHQNSPLNPLTNVVTSEENSTLLENGDKNRQETRENNLKTDSDNSIGQKWQDLGSKNQIILIAILLSTLPTLIIGSIAPYTESPVLSLSAGIGITAIIVSILVNFLTKKAFIPAEKPTSELYLQEIATLIGEPLEINSNNQESQLEQLTLKLQTFAQQQEKTTQHRQLFSSLAFRLRATPTLDILYQTTVQGAKEILGVDRVVIYRFNPDWTGTMVAEAVNPEYPQVLNETIGDPCFRQKSALQYQNGRIRGINDIYTEVGLTDCHVRLLEKYRVRANLVVPIRHDQGLFGLLIAHQCSGARIWQKTDIDFLSQLATEVEYGLDYISFYVRQQTEAQKAWFFGDIAFRARQSSNISELFQLIVGGARQILKTDRVLIYRFNPDYSGTMVAESVAAGFPKVLDETIDDPCFRGSYIDLYKNGRVRAINNIRTEANLTDCYIRTLEKYAVKANLIAPLKQDNELIGLIIAHQCSKPRNWKKSDQEFFAQLANQVEYALDHLSFIEKIQSTAQRARLFGDIAFRARQSVDRNDIFKVIVQGARRSLNTDRVLVYRFNPDWSGTMIAESVGAGWPSVLNEKIDDPCFRGRYVDAYREGRVRAISNIQTEPGLTDCHIRTLEQYEVKANIVAPLRLDGQLFGLLIAHNCTAPRPWHKAEIDFFSELATQAEYAVAHLHFLDKLETAKKTAENASLEQRQQKEAIESELDQLLQDVNGVFQGDLTVRSHVSAGEIGRIARFLNDTMDHLQHLVLQVQSSAHLVIQTAQDSEAEINVLSQEAQQADQAIAKSLGEIQTMAESIRGVAQRAQQAQTKVSEADTVLKEGDTAMNQTVRGILAVQETVEEVAGKIKRLGEASQKISRVVNLIRDLANQTHVLALNASIEANGTKGESQGFSLVAEEVRSLAEQSKAALEEIEQILEEVQTETNQVVMAMETGREQVIEGTNLVEKAKTKLNAIAAVSHQIYQLVEAIAQAASNQATASTSVSQTMQEVAAIARHTSTQSVAGAESFTQLLGVAQELQKSVSQFKVQ
jgi:methyl-accepting chemotaxis protein PixJ